MSEASAKDRNGESRRVTPVAMVLHLDDDDDDDDAAADAAAAADDVDGADIPDDDDDDDESDEEDEEDEDEDSDEGVDEGADGEEDDEGVKDDEVDEDEAARHGGEEVRIDVEGRIAGVSDCGLDFAFRSFPAAVCPPERASETTKDEGVAASKPRKRTSREGPSSWDRETLIANCKAAFVGESFWLGADAEPRCALESLAQIIFLQHTRVSTRGGGVFARGGDQNDVDDGPGFDPGRSGAEWWVQLRHAEDGQNETVSFHWDKDEDLVDDYGVNVHPAISTVTYLTDAGAPTMVLTKRAPIMYEDLDGFRGEVLEAYLSYPKAGKHIAFDGRLLHGAPRELAREGSAPPGYLRVSFLVNVWLDYKPRGIEPFPEEELANLGLSPPLSPSEVATVEAGFGARVVRSVAGGGNTDSGTFEVVSVTGAPDEECTTFEYKFGETGTEHLLRVPLPLRLLASCRGDCVELQFGKETKGERAEVVAQEAEKGERKKKKKKKNERIQEGSLDGVEERGHKQPRLT